MVGPLRHRQTKGAATDLFYLTPPRYISTLPKAPFWKAVDHFRSTPTSRPFQSQSLLRVRANSGLMQRSKTAHYSITSSARASNVGGTSRPSAFAVLRL